MPELVFFRRNEELMRVSLDGTRLTVGRGGACDVLVPDPSVSRAQFALERGAPETWTIKDLSGRGTDVGGKVIAEGPLEDGADIALGQWRAVFNLAGGDDGGDTTRRGAGGTVVHPSPDEKARVLAARVRVRTPAGGDQWLPFAGEATLGSGEGCDVRIADPYVSALHARIQRRGNGFLVRDLESRNGTFVGALRVFEVEVPFGCAVRLGNAEISLVRPDQEGQLEAFEGMVGGDPGMRKVYDTIDRVAPSSAAVAIFGESGTGKELVARALHNRSPRAGRSFVPVNCGAISKELVESELFGHEKGAFTGAERLRTGAFEEADGGTLFLDEIGELPLALQAKLLRALELGEIKRVGATRPMNVDARIVAATNRDLRAEVKRGNFREDLYWRLCVVPIQLPPLRARKGDLKALTAHFLKAFAPQGTTVALAPDAEKRLLDHDWPGNVRELKNTIHRSLLLRLGATVQASDVTFERDLDLSPAAAAEAEGPYDPDVDDLTRVYIVGKGLEQIDDEVFVKTCRRLGSSATVVARALRQSRGAAYRRMEKLGIAPGGDPPGPTDEAEEAQA